MTTSLITEFGAMGALILLGGTLFKRMLESDKERVAQRKEEVEYFRSEIEKTRNMYQVELNSSRETFLESMKQVSSRMTCIEDNINDIKVAITNNNNVNVKSNTKSNNKSKSK